MPIPLLLALKALGAEGAAAGGLNLASQFGSSSPFADLLKGYGENTLNKIGDSVGAIGDLFGGDTDTDRFKRFMSQDFTPPSIGGGRTNILRSALGGGGTEMLRRGRRF